ncbi:hypothetical protein BVX95_01980 [archaeon D22]|nr:hypothetical protein BVX95_01980 [archaeon D22]
MTNVEDIKCIYRLLGHKKQTEIRVFGKGAKSIFVTSEDEFVEKVLRFNNASEYTGVYVGYNERALNGTTKKSVISCKYALIDLDNADENDDLELDKNLEDKGIKIQLKVQSGHGYHYWIPIPLIEGNDKVIETLEKIVKPALLSLHPKNDSKIYDAGRVIRIAGTVNKKKEPFVTCKILKKNDVSEDEIIANFTVIQSIFSRNDYGNEVIKEGENKIQDTREDAGMCNVLAYFAKHKKSAEGQEFNDVLLKNFVFKAYRELGHDKALKFAKIFSVKHGHSEPEAEGWVNRCSNEECKFNCHELCNWSKKYYPEHKLCMNCKLNSKPLDIIEGNEFMNIYDTAGSWVISDIVCDKGLTAVVGAGESTKSLFLQACALHMATGKKKFSEGITIQPGTVVLLDEENRGVRLRRRVRKLMTGHNLNRSKFDIHFYVDSKLKLDDDSKVTKAHFNRLKEYLKKVDAKMVIFDSLVRFMKNDENDVVNVRCVFDMFKEIINECGCSVVFIHHTRKEKGNGGNAIRGSSDIFNMLDNAIVFTKSGNKINLKTIKSRDEAEKVKYNFRLVDVESDMDSNSPRCDEYVIKGEKWHLVNYSHYSDKGVRFEFDSKNTSTDPVMSTVDILKDEIISFMSANPGKKFKTKEIIENSSGKKTNVNEALNSLVDDEMIVKVSKGYWQYKGNLFDQNEMTV